MDTSQYTTEQVIQLIHTLYDPASTAKGPDLVVQIQATLQSIQKETPRGWHLADELLNYNEYSTYGESSLELNCKFFGALTYTVNLQLHIKELNDDEKNALKIKLLNHLAVLITDQQMLSRGLFIIKKMLSNLSILYIHTFSKWQNPVLDIILTITNNNEVTNQDLVHIIPQLTIPLINVILLSSQIIVEDIIKKEITINDVDKVSLYDAIHTQLFSTTELILGIIVSNNNTNNYSHFLAQDDDGLLIDTWLSCFNAWVHHASSAEHDTIIRYNFSNLIQALLNLLLSSAISTDNIELLNKIIQALFELLDSNPTFVKKSEKDTLHDILFGNWGSNYYNCLMFESEDYESLEQFGRLIISFSEMDLINLAYQLSNSANDSKFQLLLKLSVFNNLAPIKEEQISKEFVDFWCELIDCFVMDEERLMVLLDNNKSGYENLLEKFKSILFELTKIYWQKIHILDNDPNSLILNKDYKEEFRVYRRDVSDMFQSIYQIIGKPLYNDLINSVLSNVESSIENSGDDERYLKLSNIESSLFLLSSLSEVINEDEIPQSILDDMEKVLNSKLLNIVIAEISPTKLQYSVHTSIHFLSSIDWFYKTNQGVSYLPSTLEFLFGCLINANKQYELIASKTISHICDNCRSSLFEFLPNFENVIVEMVNNVDVDSFVRQRIIKSYSSILQGVKSPLVQCENLLKMFELIDTKSYQIITELRNNQQSLSKDVKDSMIEYLLSLLKGIESISKGMQLPDESYELYTPEQTAAINQFWVSNSKAIHLKQIILKVLLNFTNSCDLLIDNFLILEAIVDVFQNGLTESVKGPFVFQMNEVVDFILLKSQSFNYIAKPKSYSLLFQLFSSVITCYYLEMETSAASTDYIYGIISKLFTSRLESIQCDPDSITSSVNLFSNILQKKPSLLLQYRGDEQSLQFQQILRFCVENISSNERFVIKAVDSFWCKLITLKRGSREDTQLMVSLFETTELGSRLSYELINNLIKTQRSQIEYFTNMIKAVVVKFPRYADKWFLASLPLINSQRSNPVDETKFKLFIKKLMVTRGMRSANPLIKDFWVDVNNLTDFI